MAEHAKYSPSSASRWLRCPASVDFKDSTSNSSADEGTMLHHVAFVCGKYGIPAEQAIGQVYAGGEQTYTFTEEHSYLLENGLKYLSNFRKGGKAFFEHKVDISALIPNQFGTADFIYYGANELVVADWKFGRVKVSVKDNEQLLLYAYGAWQMLGKPECSVTLACIQPRVSGSVKTYQTDHLAFLEIESKVKTSLINKDFVAGPVQCVYCPNKDNCTTFSKHVLDLIFLIKRSKMAGLTTQQKIDIYLNSNLISKTLEKIGEDLHKEYDAGTELPGLKLVEGGMGRRFFKDEKEAVNVLQNWITEGILEQDDIYKFELKTPTQIVKILSKIDDKKVEELSVNIGQQRYKSKLVAESEDGEKISPGIEAFNIFDTNNE